MVSVIAPIVAGAILGNLDDDIKQFFGSHEPIIVPFMAFTLGQTINLKSVVTAGIPGVVLGVTVVAVTGFVCILADKLLGGTGIAGAAASSTAGNSAAVPQAVALADKTYVPVAEAATVQVAASVIVTAILTPLLTSWWYSSAAQVERVAREADARGSHREARVTPRRDAQPRSDPDAAGGLPPRWCSGTSRSGGPLADRRLPARRHRWSALTRRASSPTPRSPSSSPRSASSS